MTADPTSAAAVYRCAECGHGRYLTAWAIILAHGPVGPDGHIARYDWDEEDLLQEDSIECSKHPDSVTEMLVDGQWCRWWTCPSCKGETHPGWDRCTAPGLPPERGTYRERHKGWRPVETAAVL